jgi:hypothetical protein
MGRDAPERFRYRRERLKMLLLWGPLGLALFGLGGARVLDRNWGLDHGGVVSGAATGAAVVLLLASIVALRWHHRIPAAELEEAQDVYANRDDVAPKWPIWAGTGCTTTACAVGTAIAGSSFLLAFLFSLMALATVLAWVLALFRRGLFQAPPAEGASGATGSPAARQA